MTDTPLITAARQWVVEHYTYNSTHLLKTLDWLDRLAPDAGEAARLAALTHDMERAFPGPDQPVQRAIGSADDPAYYAAHAARSARIVGAWLREQAADGALVEEVERLIRAHETGGWPEADLVQAADSLSFLEVNVELFLNMARAGRRTPDEVLAKFDDAYQRIRVERARELAWPLYQQARAAALQLQKTDSFPASS